jgi:hypothetical protein
MTCGEYRAQWDNLPADLAIGDLLKIEEEGKEHEEACADCRAFARGRLHEHIYCLKLWVARISGIKRKLQQPSEN